MIDGHRRVLACRHIGLVKIEAVIREFDDRQAHISSIRTNLQIKELGISYWGNAVHLELPTKLSKDQKVVFSNLMKEKIKEVLGVLNL